MFGRFLEIAIGTGDAAASLQFYAALGFEPLSVNDSWPHPYCALSDGQMVIGLHADGSSGARLAFVRPGLLQHRSRLQHAGFDIRGAHLIADDFHRLVVADPDGRDVLLLEARTCSPPHATTQRAPGALVGWSMPSNDVDGAARFWERAGLVAFQDASGWPPCTLAGDGLSPALHQPASFSDAALVYVMDDAAPMHEWLDARGLRGTRWTPRGATQPRGMLLRAPEGTAVLLLHDEAVH